MSGEENRSWARWGQDTYLLFLLFALCAGIAAGYVLPFLPFGGQVLCVALLAVIAAVGVFRGRAWTGILLLLLAFAVGIFRMQAVWQLPETDISHFAKQEVRVKGTLTEEPRRTLDARGQERVRYTVEAQKVRTGGMEQKAGGGLYVYAAAPKDGALPQIGDTVTARGKIRTPHGYLNPGQIDTELLLRADGITASLAAGKAGATFEQNTNPTAYQRLQRVLSQVRQHYRDRMGEVMPKEDAAVLFAMLFGGYDGIKPEVVEDFTTTGIVHILSVSGSHISLLAAATAWLALLLHLPRKATGALAVLFIALYAMLAGCVPPVLRAAIMGSLAFLAAVLGRERDVRRLLLLSGLMMLLVSPLLLFHISFELSFAATAGLLYLAPAWGKGMVRRGIPRALAGSLSITLAAQMATLPLLAWYFHQVSLSSLLANLFVVPILEGIIVVCLAAGLIAFVLPFFGKGIFLLSSLAFGLAEELTHLFAQMPGSQVWVPVLPLPLCAVFYAVLALSALPEEERGRLWQLAGKWGRKKEKLWKGLGAGMACVTVFFAAASLFRPAELTVHFLDVGQGDAALVVTPHGHAFLFDTGGVREGRFDVGSRVDVPYLLHYGIRRVDAVFLTHAHEDHAAGCGGILAKLPVGAVYTAGEGVQAYARSMRLGDASPFLLKFHPAQQGQKLSVDGVTIEVLYAPQPSGTASGGGNEFSNVYRVSYGAASFLFTGDLVAGQEQRLLEENISPQATVLKVGHHGSDTSSSAAFLRAVSPQAAVICVGRDNSFGHPKPVILERLREAHIPYYRTDEDGAVVFHTDGKRLWQETYTGREAEE